MGTEFQCCKMKRETEKDDCDHDCDGCTLCMYLIPFNCTVKIINMVSFMCIYHNRRIKQQQQRMSTQEEAGEDRARRNSSGKKEIGWEYVFGYNITTVIFRTGMKCVLHFMVKSERAK